MLSIFSKRNTLSTIMQNFRLKKTKDKEWFSSKLK